MTDKPPLGFIGMGLMGSRMAARLLDAGYPLTVYNRSRQKTEPLAQRGAVVAGSPRDLAARSEIVMISVADDQALRQVMLGPEGAVTSLHEGSVVIDFSTVSPAASRAVSAVVAKRGTMLDVPVSGPP